jgi:type IV secretory pathway VirB4 component
MIYIKPSLFQEEDGFKTVTPLGTDKLNVIQKLNSEPISSMFPFVSFDLTSEQGILYGVNRHNSSLVIFDRFSLENYNSIIFAKSGAGKSYATKLEIIRTLMFDTDVIVIDPEREYEYLAEAIGGRYFNISLSSDNHINPFDLPIPRIDESPADVLRSNIINLVGLFRIMLGGLTPEEDSIIDRAITETYSLKDITPESNFAEIEPPLLSDFEMVLSGMEGTESVLQRLTKYTHGSWATFINQPTNVDINKKFVVFSVRDMEDDLKPAAMYIVTHFIWNAVRKELRKRLLVVDEAWWMMKSDDTASFLYSIAKRGRKYYLGLCTITQDVGDFMKSPYGVPIVTNSSIQLLLKQSPSTMDVLQKTFNLTDEEKFLLLESGVGEGIFFAGLKHVAIKIIASYTEDQIITSDPSQVISIRAAKKEFSEQNK